MTFRKMLGATLLLAFITGAAGCATSSAVAEGEAMSVQIEVDNNLRGITGVSVYLISPGGSRRSLGPIESNNRATYNRELRAGDYQLVATRVGDSDIVSERFRVDTNGLVVRWALAQNQLTFGQR